MARHNLKPGALTAPLPPVLVTVGNTENSNIITIGWTGILATHPPKTYISVRPERYSHGLLRKTGEFVINLATVDMARAVDFAGIYTGSKVDKWSKCGFTKAESLLVSCPTILESPLSIECRVSEVIPMGTHDVFVADIISVSCDDSIMDGDGRLCFDKANLLAYAHGEYFALGEKVGIFGFSTDKPLKNSTRLKSSSKLSVDGGAKNKNTDSKPFYLTAPKGKGKKKGAKRK
jgi:flavin reductase (DIM6/NTAB) family NADH-FMN oxidoreductase RutF